MTFDSNSSSNSKDPLRYPIASGRVVSIWIKEGDENYYFNVEVDAPLLGKSNFSVDSTERATSFVNQVGESWKENAETAGDE
ncbi:MAG: hypothetical protein ACI8Z7_000206 [Candidatus Nanohaloarchaea archaeon]|jgi:hypothetical protein